MSIDFRKNANVLTAVQKFSKPKERTISDPYVVDGYELHARPELADRLRNLMAGGAPGARLEFAFGIPMLCTSTGRVFATAGGTHSLSLFLPEEESWATPTQNTENRGGRDTLGRKANHTRQMTKSS